MEKLIELETITFKVPRDKINKLNNFYLENFKYDIYTQLQNFIMSEYERCKKYPSDEAPEHPHPCIDYANHTSNANSYCFEVKYPDGSNLQTLHSDYDLLINLWNEWSKHGFTKESRDDALLKIMPERIKSINYRDGVYEVVKTFGNRKRRYGKYKNIEDALVVKRFLVSNNWDEKYHHKNLIDTFEKCNINNYSEYLLKIAKGECKL